MNQIGCRLPGALAVAASVLALSGCSLMIPVGPLTAEERDISDVSRVVLDTSGDLVVSEGEPALTVHAPEGMIGRLTSDWTATPSCWPLSPASRWVSATCGTT